jgi:alkanesulfonate monooxygenase SsuD/methylene tetrahydromethanopterin reductase-like flavin-dependent oxidoreductase (luciferase family)
MEFGYFTLSDNGHSDNPRTAEARMLEIRGQAVHAETIGMRSTWIGEHHFNRRGCVPVHVGEEWVSFDVLSAGRVNFALGRGYDSHRRVRAAGR